MNPTKLSDLKPGDIVILDGGFTCMSPGPRLVKQDDHGLYLDCTGPELDPDDEASLVLGFQSHGSRHYVDGQEGDDGFLVGISRP